MKKKSLLWIDVIFIDGKTGLQNTKAGVAEPSSPNSVSGRNSEFL